MSLIQEALKRQQEEEGTLETSETATAFPTPPPPEPTPAATPTEPAITTPLVPPVTPKKAIPQPPDQLPPPLVEKPPIADNSDTKNSTPPPKNKPAKKRKVQKNPKEESSGVFPAVAGMILLVILLLASVVGAIIYGLQHFKIEMPWQNSGSIEAEAICETNTVESSKPVAIVVKEDSTTNNTPLRRAVAVGKQVEIKLEPAKEAQEPESLEKNAKQRQTNTGSKPIVAKLENSLPATEAVNPIASDVPTPKEKPVITWPSVKLKGIVGSGSGGSVIINSTVAGVNEKVEGIIIISIEPKGAWLEYKKERRFLKVGKSFQ